MVGPTSICCASVSSMPPDANPLGEPLQVSSCCTKNSGEPEIWVHTIWSYDFAMDATEDARRLKVMPIVDEYSRECPRLEAERSITAEDVVEVLDRLFIERGEPAYIRSDNGPEFIAGAIKRWLAASGVETLYIEPGAPWENAYSETFISWLRDELLNREVFANLKEARVLAGDYREHYNHYRPHGALDYLTPAEFAAEELQQLETVLQTRIDGLMSGREATIRVLITRDPGGHHAAYPSSVPLRPHRPGVGPAGAAASVPREARAPTKVAC